MSPEEMKAFIKESFARVIEDPNATQETYARYFAPEYIQRVDGKEFGFTGFVEHMKALKEATETIKISYQHLIAEGDKVCSVHVAHALKKDGEKVEVKVISVCQIKDGRIVLVDELTHLVSGDAADRDLGSRR